MNSRSKKRLKKRKVEDSSREIIEIPLHRRKLGGDNEVVIIENGDKKEVDADQTEAMLLPTRQSTANQLIVALRGKHFVIVEGPMGSGKTFLVSHAAKELGLPLKTMQMGDQVDSKSLFGSYNYTEVAGQILWKSSSFSEWLQERCIILLEEIDSSNADVISTIVQLASRRSAVLPCGTELSLNEEVRIVATMSGKGKKSSLLDGIPVRVILDQLTDEELRRIVTKAWPRISHLAKTLISIFRSLENVHSTSNSRQLTSTDLLRGCARVYQLSDLSSNIAIFTELVDVWCLADVPERALKLCEKVAASLSITGDQVSFHLSLRQPTFSRDDRWCTVGRCRLPSSPTLHSARGHRLGHTRDVLQLMERLAVCIKNREPVLLVGETGVGKTSVVQSLASAVNAVLKVVNLSPSSDFDELINGYKPASIAHVLTPFTQFYYEVFRSTFDTAKNLKFLSHLEACLSSGRYRDYLSVAIATAEKALLKQSKKKDSRWASVIVRGRRIRESLENGAALFALSRGAVLEAAQEGHWLLIDEINLAPAESLDAIVHAILGDVHPDFRLFACMNPATDAGKRRLPASVRTRFTEFYVPEMTDAHQIALVVSAYLPSMKSASVNTLVNFYLQAKQLYPMIYSLRTLCRALMFAAENMFGSEDRSMYEAICMAFLTNLDAEAKDKMRAKIAQTFRVATNIPIRPPHGKAENYVLVEGYWIERGTEIPLEDTNYVVTKTVKQNLAEIARITSSGRFPILLEGETSSGKTSIVCHLGRITGNAIIRINNHEHTDVQEYMGSYVGDANGRLVFQEGALVKAVRDGSWVILDELNLAPTDIIEALNRLLDDNRELYVPETNVVIKAHPRFRLFATQNPAGIYGGRKRLSRALMSRFIVLRFNNIPLDELSSMVCVRCGVHASAASKMINVLSKLRVKRSISGVFSARDGLMTLRDVFRWAKRLATDATCDDWLQVLANHGYFLLAGRCRNQKDVVSVVETLESELNRRIDPSTLFAINSPYMPKDINASGIVMTLGMRRMLVMTEQAWLRNEAVLIVGETGGGKTSLAQAIGKDSLMTINCHERTETADFLGRLRPRDNGGFAWVDGVVIDAMKAGVPLLIDEISLAEDSVLERLNPLFEEDRTLLLSDAGVEVHPVSAREGFQIIATMNPGGDYGKKELSKALRNRFTELWSSNDYEGSELLAIFNSRLTSGIPSHVSSLTSPAELVINWIREFFRKYRHMFRQSASVRDVVACAEIYSACAANGLPLHESIYEAVSAVFLDALNGQQLRVATDLDAVRSDAKLLLQQLSSGEFSLTPPPSEIQITASSITIGAFSLPYGSLRPELPKGFCLRAPTSVANFYRIARGLLIKKPILLEGAPGCGKSSTVMALAKLTGQPITRLNLSDQTDLSDLFGSDVPIVSDDGSISFRWEDGPILRAIKRGEWILLDEMNLAPQAVLEGLNACFDHRRVLYIAELNRSFEIPSQSSCRFFACQNPRAQGGNRRALPKSFVNRFTNIYVDDLTDEDVLLILSETPTAARIGNEKLRAMVSMNCRLASQQGLLGGPFSFNLRDLLRWIQLFDKTCDMASCFQLLYLSRMRREEDREKLRRLYSDYFNEPVIPRPVVLSADENQFRIGQVLLPRKRCIDEKTPWRLLASQSTLIHQLSVCIDMKWMPLIIGPRNCGKRSALECLAQICGVELHTIVLTPETDAQELIGSYEQVIDDSALNDAKTTLCSLLEHHVGEGVLKKLNDADDVTQLEMIAELELVDMKESNNSVVDECREVLAHAARSAMRFEWIDSLFVRAYLNGHWLLIEDVNLCSAAVLDRLNSCLESDGRLVVSERQSSYEPLEPHPNFRVFLSMDSRNGEISRAMRNRSVEIFVEKAQQWNANPPDIAAVVHQYGKTIPFKVLDALSSLSAEKQLHFSALLSEISLEEACRIVGIPCSAMDDDGIQSCSIAPFVKEIGTDKYESWLLEIWKSSSEADVLPGLFLALLSSSTSVLRGTLFCRVFGDSALPVVNRLSEITQEMDYSRHPIDSRFNQSCDVSKTEFRETIQKFVVVTTGEWFSWFVKTVEICPESAEYLSRSLSKFELTRQGVSFKNVRLIASAVDAVIDTFKCVSQVWNEDEVYMFCLRLALFVVACRQPLDSRTGFAPLYLAWNEIYRLIPKSAVDDVDTPKSCSVLSKLLHLMSEGWPMNAHDHFINSYLPFYKAYRVAEPFYTEEESQRLCSVSCPSGSDDASYLEIHMEVLKEDKTEVSPTSNQESPVLRAINLVSLMRHFHSSLCTGSADQPCGEFDYLLVIESIRWRNEQNRKFARGVALLNSVCHDNKKFSSLLYDDAFSTVVLSFWKNVDFDPQLSSLSVSDLVHCELKKFVNQLWRLAANSTLLSRLITDVLKSANSGMEELVNGANRPVDDWRIRLDVALGIMQKALPPRNTLDPVIFEEQREAYQLSVFHAVDQPLSVLAKWRNAVSKQPPECDSRSSHPVIATLWKIRSESCKLLEGSQEKPRVFRQKASLYSSMCDEMRQFFGIAASTATLLSGVDTDVGSLLLHFSSQELFIIVSQIRSFVVSALGFRKKILSTFASFVDVTMTFIQGLDVFLCGLYEACDLIEAVERRRELQMRTAFPIKFNVKSSLEGLQSVELLSWCCRDASPMPLPLKAAIVKRQLTSGDDPKCNLVWIRRQWQKWYEKNIAKAAEKDFVYRDKTEEEKDEFEVEEFFSEREQEREILSDATLGLLLETNQQKSASSTATRSAGDLNYVLALLWLRHVLVGVRHFDPALHSSTIDSDLFLLEDISSKIVAESDSVLDVYRSSSCAQFRRAAEILKPLEERTRIILERFPEQVPLSLILEAIKIFSNAKLCTAQVKMAIFVENIIEQCEEWEKIADRANSLRHELAPLRELLVDWKKMEVRSWGELLNRVERDGQVRAQLVVFPLFDALFKAETPEAQTALLAMSTEWIGNASLLDYSTRIRSVHCLADWAELLGYSSISDQLHSISAHFEQYIPAVDQSLREAREPAEHALRDYMKIVKFNDLNLWNIKASSQKAHTHLYKIVRKFREAVGVQVSPLFDKLVHIGSASVAALPDWSEVMVDGRGRRARELADVIITQAASFCDITGAVELTDQTNSCDEGIRVNINYQGEDEDKEKQQGYARNSRQRSVAMVIREAQAIGLNARKAQGLDQEKLTRSSLTEVKRKLANEVIVHKCAAGRNSCIRKGITPNDQLGVATRKHLIGVIDYGMAWILKCHRQLADWEQSYNVLVRKTHAFECLESNVEAGWFVDYERLKAQLEFILARADELVQYTNAMSHRLSSVPDRELNEEPAEWEHPLSRLHSQSPELEGLRKLVNDSLSLSKKIHQTASSLLAESEAEVCGKLTVTRSFEHLSSDGTELKVVLGQLQEWFEYECSRAGEALSGMLSKLSVDEIEAKMADVSMDLPLLLVQNLYKSLAENVNINDMRLMDRFDFVLNAMAASGYEKVVAWATQTLSSAIVGLVPNSLKEITSLLHVVTRLFSAINGLVSSAMQAFASLYHALLSMTMQLFEKGYVNPIPKAEKQESGQGNADEAGEGGGIGEGEAKGDAKDVTDEMEESGQIEGLQDDECEPPSGDAGQNEKPIEMEEDFPEDIQDIDRNEAGDDDEKSGENSEEEADPEDQMGDVDEADEQQLDPKLWDEEEKDPSPKGMDEDNAAADNKTDALAAKEDDTVTADEKSAENEGEEESNDKQADDMENVDERERDDQEDNGREDPLLPPEDELENEQEVSNIDDVDNDSTDDEQGKGNEECEGEEDKNENDNENAIVEDEQSASSPPNDKQSEDNMEAVEQGTGGAEEKDEHEEQSGGVKENENREIEDKGGEEGRADASGEAGKAINAMRNDEEKENEENEQDSVEIEENVERQRELAQDFDKVEDKVEGEGELDETATQMQNAPAAERQMLGAGSLEEAKQSRKEDTAEQPKEHKKPSKGVEESADGPLQHDGDAIEERQAAIHLAPEEMFNLAEKLTKELTVSAEREETAETVKNADSDKRDLVDAEQMWTAMSQTVGILAAELAENLRLILEPQRASKMQGGYRTGKRLNMRRLIPYIASEYRKDRIWMRRTKKAQRDYQVLIAVDDSASMNENGIHQVTCESVCIVDDALRRCDAGDVSVCSFGSELKVISAFGDHMTPGPELLQKLSFNQSSTDLLLLLNRTRQLLSDVRTPTSEQLLIIISDGRGALAQGAEKVKAALASLRDVTVLFVILDSGPKSICDLSVAAFKDGDVVLTPYLATFPFPFYAIVKTVTQLPSVLAESIRQWFEMTVQTNSN